MRFFIVSLPNQLLWYMVEMYQELPTINKSVGANWNVYGRGLEGRWCLGVNRLLVKLTTGCRYWTAASLLCSYHHFNIMITGNTYSRLITNKNCLGIKSLLQTFDDRNNEFSCGNIKDIFFVVTLSRHIE